MAKYWLKKTQYGHLAPADDRAEKALKRMKVGEPVELEITRKRNNQHHRKFMKLIEIVWENQEYFESKESLLLSMKVALGYFDTSMDPKFGPVPIPRSISFDKMDQGEFEEFYERCLDFIAEKIIPGLGKRELAAEVESFL